MELMSTSFEKLYKSVHNRLKETIPEDIIGRIGLCVSNIIYHDNTLGQRFIGL